MSQFPSKLPPELQALFTAIENGELARSADTDLGGGNDSFGKSGVQEITGTSGVSAATETNDILRDILRTLSNLPSAIWDEVEGR